MSEAAILSIIAVALVFIAMIALTMALYVKNRLSMAKAARIPPAGATLAVPLVAAFSGWKGVPWLCWSSSNLSPKLILHADRIECRVIRTRTKPYAAVSNVDYRETFATTNVVLEFSGSLSSFVGNTANADLARQAISFLAQKGCPLSARAERLLGGE